MICGIVGMIQNFIDWFLPASYSVVGNMIIATSPIISAAIPICYGRTGHLAPFWTGRRVRTNSVCWPTTPCRISAWAAGTSPNFMFRKITTSKPCWKLFPRFPDLCSSIRSTRTITITTKLCFWWTVTRISTMARFCWHPRHPWLPPWGCFIMRIIATKQPWKPCWKRGKRKSNASWGRMDWTSAKPNPPVWAIMPTGLISWTSCCTFRRPLIVCSKKKNRKKIFLQAWQIPDKILLLRP